MVGVSNILFPRPIGANNWVEIWLESVYHKRKFENIDDLRPRLALLKAPQELRLALAKTRAEYINSSYLSFASEK